MSSMYKADPNDNTKMVPKTPDFTNHNKATTPAAGVVSDRPNYVILNNAGTYKFCYNTTASLNTNNGSAHQEFISASVLDADAGPVRMEIQPVSWGITHGTKTGDVTFVYTGVK